MTGNDSSLYCVQKKRTTSKTTHHKIRLSIILEKQSTLMAFTWNLTDKDDGPERDFCSFLTSCQWPFWVSTKCLS